MRTLTGFLAAIALIIAGSAVAQGEPAEGIVALTMEEGTLTEFITSDPEIGCEEKVDELMAEDVAEDEEVAADEEVTEDIVAVGLDDYVCLREAVQAAGLSEALEGNVTLLAPTDRAFADYLEFEGLLVQDFFADTERLSEVLQYHVIPDGRTLADIIDVEDATVTTALGPEIGFDAGVAGGGAAAGQVDEVEEVFLDADALGDVIEFPEVVGNTVAFAEGYLIPINAILAPPAQ